MQQPDHLVAVRNALSVLPYWKQRLAWERAQGDVGVLNDIVSVELESEGADPPPHLDCPICIAPKEHGQEVVYFDCGHSLHLKCASDMLVNKLEDRIIYLLDCPLNSTNGCNGKLYLSETERIISVLDITLTKQSDDTDERIFPNWRRAWADYSKIVRLVVLKSARRLDWLSCECTSGSNVDTRNQFEADDSCNIVSCQFCGEDFCLACSESASRAITFHAPIPCNR